MTDAETRASKEASYNTGIARRKHLSFAACRPYAVIPSEARNPSEGLSRGEKDGGIPRFTRNDDVTW